MRSTRSAHCQPCTREFMTFLGGSAVGLTIDLVGFQLLLVSGLEPWLANMISSSASITTVYLLVSRYSFGTGTRLSTYTAFLAWYTMSILTFSMLIQFAVSETDWHPFLWKLISVPVSFLLNYTFSRFLFRTPGTGTEGLPESDTAPQLPMSDNTSAPE